MTILNRINEISFNSSLMHEMRASNFVTKLIGDEMIKPHALKRMLIHSIADEQTMSNLSVASKLNVDWRFFTDLRGRESVEARVTANYEILGVGSSIDIRNT